MLKLATYLYRPFGVALPCLIPAPNKGELSFSKSPPVSVDFLFSALGTIYFRKFPFSLA